MFLLAVITAATSFATSNVRLEARLSSDHIYVGEPVALYVTIYSDYPQIQYVNLAKDAHLDGFTTLNAPVSRSRDDYMRESDNPKKGKYSAIVYRLMLMPTETGVFTLPALEFEVGVVEGREVYDPFWGRRIVGEVKDLVLSTEKIRAKIHDLPKPKDGYSGAVGDFSIKSLLPPGKITEGQRAIVVFQVSGTGYLDSEALPDLRSFLPSGLRFSSESPETRHTIEGNELITDLIVECSFIPKESGVFEIPSVPFTYFNPASRKYVTVSTEPIQVKVDKSPTRKSSSSSTIPI